MKAKKTATDILGIIAVSMSIIGIITFILTLLINIFFFKEMSPTWNSIGIIGAFAFMLPFFILQFAMPSGLLNYLGVNTDIPFWGKLMFYLILFPFANIWMISVADAAFHFLPNLHEAMEQGVGRLTLQIMHEQRVFQSWKTLVILYTSMVGAGLLFKVIIGNKLKAKVA